MFVPPSTRRSKMSVSMAKKPFLAWDGFEYRDVQDENGVDLELLRHNLSLTPDQRLAEFEALGRTFELLRSAGRVNKPAASA